MNLYALSDLHNEFAPFDAQTYAGTWAAQADAIVLAGDIDQGVAGIRWARESFASQPIVYVAGNHEFYGGYWERTLDDMRHAAREHEVFFLENDAVLVGGVRFLGCTLWTDFELFGEGDRTWCMGQTEKALNDYRRIANDAVAAICDHMHGEAHKLAPEHTRLRHLASRAWLEKELARGDPEKTVVVTHHFPSMQSCAHRYRSDPVTAGFGSQLPPSLITRAALWIHGHTHDSCDYGVWHQDDEAFRETHVVCNPRGYPRWGMPWRCENTRFDPELLVEV